MRKWAFILFFLGMFVLLILFLSPVKKVDNLEGLEINTRIAISGKVVSEREIYSGTKLLILDNDIELICECEKSFKDSSVNVEGIVSEYNKKKQVTVEKIWSTNK